MTLLLWLVVQASSAMTQPAGAPAPPPPLLNWGDVGKAAAILGVAFAFLRWLLWPVMERTAARLVASPAVREALDAAQAKRFQRYDEQCALAEVNRDRLDFVEAAVRQQGAQIADIPRMEEAMKQMTRAVEKLEGTLNKLHGDIGATSNELAEFRGMLRSGGSWDGTERRRASERRSGAERRAVEGEE